MMKDAIPPAHRNGARGIRVVLYALHPLVIRIVSSKKAESVTVLNFLQREAIDFSIITTEKFPL